MNIKHSSTIESLDEEIRAFDIINDIRWIEVGRHVVICYDAWVQYLHVKILINPLIEYLTR